MTGLPRMAVKRGALFGLLRRFTQPASKLPRARAAERGDIALWRRHLHSSEEALRHLNTRSVGVPEDEIDPELCLVKGEVLRRAGHDYDAQRFLRRAARLSPTRRGSSGLALRAALHDLGFQRIIHEADLARDAGEWTEAGELYHEALRAYPDHHGYIVQYAHCLKEQGQFPEAECYYRSALALGARRSDVDEHLIFVATRQGYPANFAGDTDSPAADGGPLDAPPHMADVELVVFLLLGREPAPPEIVQLMRSHRNLRSLIAAIIEDGSFLSANTRLLSSAKPATAAISPANN
jgi:tetratricopeptide (TPR) repeat protein